MKTLLLLLIAIFCSQYCFLGAVNAVLGLNFGDSCTNSTECQPKELICLDYTCQCESGFYLNLINSCLPSENCTSSDDCNSLNSTCINGTCDCTPGLYPNITICLPQHDIFQSCNETKECLGDSLQCKDNNCTCKDDYYYRNDSCYKKHDIFESCNDTEECVGDNAECKEYICTCNDGYYHQDGACVEKSKLSERCTDASQCLDDNTQCEQNTCICKDDYYDENLACHEKYGLFDPCNDTKQCLGSNTQCKENNCTCKDKYYHENGSCNEKRKVFDSCTDARECLDDNAQCEKYTCICKDDYYYKDGACHRKRGLFSRCTATEECLGDKMDCKNGNCTCSQVYFHQKGRCIQRLPPKSDCESNNMCQELSSCVNKKCECIQGHYLDNTVCFMQVGHRAICPKNDRACKGENMFCSSGRCHCKEGYEYKDSFCQKKTSSSLIIIIVILILLLLCVLGYIVWKIKSHKSGDFDPPPKGDQIELAIPSRRPILMSKFPDYVTKMHQDNNKIFERTFLDLNRISPLILTGNSNQTSSKKYLPCNEATKPCNTSKNRFLDILPFDHSRVKLNPVDDDETTDYINASYISGYSSENEYIAAQGPLPITSTDFWRMVWQEKVSVVVMLTLCREKELNKCDNYWPNEKDKILDFDDVTVETTNVKNYDSYDYRTMTLKMDEESHSLKHFHFLNWADFSGNVPVEVLIDFVQNVRLHITSNAPVVIHCCAGVGRTGTFIAVDYMLQFVDANPLHANIDIYEFISTMRKNRVHMVQNKDQYILIHDCVSHAVKKKMESENGEPFDEGDENPYENEGFVTIDLEDKPKDLNTSQGSVEIIIEKSEDEDGEEEKEEQEQEQEEEEEEEKREKEEEKKEEEKEEEENPYENEVQVSVHMTPNEDKINEEVVDLEENPYENEDLSNPEKDKANAYESDDIPYDIPENALLIDNNETESDKSNKDANEDQQCLVNVDGDAAEEENPYENQDFEADEKQKLTNL